MMPQIKRQHSCAQLQLCVILMMFCAMRKRIAIIYPSSVNWMIHCLDGIRRYSKEQGYWHLLSSPPALRGVGGSLRMKDMDEWKGDGVIALLDEKSELEAAGRMGIPVVNLSARVAESFGIPRVLINNTLAGQMAADHLIRRGLRHLAFFGWKDAWYANQRREAFCQRAAEAGIPCSVFLRSHRLEKPKKWTQRIAEPAAWLASLPRPCGVFAAHDYLAQLLMEACNDADLRVPGDIAVIGMDNDETICEHSAPTLSSISRNSERVGWEAAALLDRLMRREAPPQEDLLIEPTGVIMRQSTDMTYCADPVVQRALDFMTRNLGKRFNIDHVAEQAAVSKRTLEMRFRDHLGISPHEHLTRLRVQRAQSLIQRREKSRTLIQTSEECGFATPRTFYAAFKRITGTPLKAEFFSIKDSN